MSLSDKIQVKIDDYNERIKEEEEIIEPLEKEFDSKIKPMVITMIIFFGSVGAVFFCAGIINTIGITCGVISGFYGKLLGKNISLLSKQIGEHMKRIDDHKREIKDLKENDVLEDDFIVVPHCNYTSSENELAITTEDKNYPYIKRL